MSRLSLNRTFFAVFVLASICLVPLAQAEPQILTLASDVQVSFTANTANQAMAICATLASTATITRITFSLAAQGTMAGATARAFIFTVASGTPAGNNCTKGSTVANSTTLDISGLPIIGSCGSGGCNYATINFLFNNQQLNTSQTFLIGIGLVADPNSGSLQIFGQTTITSAMSDVCYTSIAGCGVGTVNFALCNFVDNCFGFALYGNAVQQGPPNTQQVCVTCQSTPSQPIDFTPPVTQASITPTFSTPIIDFRPFALIGLLFFALTLGPYLIYHKKSKLSRLYEIRI